MSGVEELERAGDLVGALDELVALNRASPSLAHQRRLVELRHRAASALVSTPRSPWPPAYDDPFPDVAAAVPEIDASRLDGALMGASIKHHGSLLVRGFFDDEQVARTSHSVRRATDALNGDQGAIAEGWYEPSLGLDARQPALRQLVAKSNGVWLADSPPATAQVLDDLADAGGTAAVAEHFGERPVFSLQKSTLRRLLPIPRYTGWHQDGSFLGQGTRALNIWIALTPCGGDRPAPGLEVLPARLEDILDTDTDEGGRAAINGYAVHFMANLLDAPVVRPEFEPGDALLFDERMAHRTFLTEGMTEERLAVECWFFSPAHPNSEYLSLLV
jgi:hypothetical protein